MPPWCGPHVVPTQHTASNVATARRGLGPPIHTFRSARSRTVSGLPGAPRAHHRAPWDPPLPSGSRRAGRGRCGLSDRLLTQAAAASSATSPATRAARAPRRCLDGPTSGRASNGQREPRPPRPEPLTNVERGREPHQVRSAFSLTSVTASVASGSGRAAEAGTRQALARTASGLISRSRRARGDANCRDCRPPESRNGRLRRRSQQARSA
jgi:hypothetical protein